MLLAANMWCYVAHPLVMFHAVTRSRTLPRPATPKTISEKFLWRKIFDHNPLFTISCDKIAAKDYVTQLCPQLKTARVVWSGTDANAIPSSQLNSNVVLKANHGSGWNILDVADRPIADIRKQTGRWLKKTYGWQKGEWGYKHVPKMIFLEQALNENGEQIDTEYKFHCSSGTIAYVYVKRGNLERQASAYVLDRNGAAFTVDENGASIPSDFKPHSSFMEMRTISEQLSQAFDFVRCDLYCVQGEIYFSELTIYPMSGHGEIGNPELVDLRNALWDIRKSWFLNTTHTGIRKTYAAYLLAWLDSQSG